VKSISSSDGVPEETRSKYFCWCNEVLVLKDDHDDDEDESDLENSLHERRGISVLLEGFSPVRFQSIDEDIVLPPGDRRSNERYRDLPP